jgi:hypothetical protein
MAHYHEIIDRRGDIIDLVVFCSDYCHEQWCIDHEVEYQGWNGCHEHPYDDRCYNCEAEIHGLVEV